MTVKECQARYDSFLTDVLARLPGLQQQERDRVKGIRENFVKANVPPEYRRQIDRSQIGDPKAFDKVLQWNPTGDRPGLVAFGPSGLCKTRAIYLRLAQLHLEKGTVFAALTASTFKRRTLAVAMQEDDDGDAAEELSGLRTAPILFLDDFSQTALSARYAEELYELVEERTSYGRPCCFSVQVTGDALSERIAGFERRFADTACAIVRRIRDFCTPVKFSGASKGS